MGERVDLKARDTKMLCSNYRIIMQVPHCHFNLDFKLLRSPIIVLLDIIGSTDPAFTQCTTWVMGCCSLPGCGRGNNFLLCPFGDRLQLQIFNEEEQSFSVMLCHRSLFLEMDRLLASARAINC